MIISRSLDPGLPDRWKAADTLVPLPKALQALLIRRGCAGSLLERLQQLLQGIPAGYADALCPFDLHGTPLPGDPQTCPLTLSTPGHPGVFCWPQGLQGASLQSLCTPLLETLWLDKAASARQTAYQLEEALIARTPELGAEARTQVLGHLSGTWSRLVGNPSGTRISLEAGGGPSASTGDHPALLLLDPGSVSRIVTQGGQSVLDANETHDLGELGRLELDLDSLLRGVEQHLERVERARRKAIAAQPGAIMQGAP